MEMATTRTPLVMCAMLLGLACRGENVWAGSLSPGAEATQPVRIELQSPAFVPDGEVKIRNIAKLDGGDASLRMRIAELDVADSPERGQLVRVTRDQVVFRLQLAGIHTSEFEVTGVRTVTVSAQTCEVAQEELIEVASRALSDKLGPNPDDFQIEISQPPRGPIRVPGKREVVQLEGAVQLTRSLIGKVRVDVRIRCNDTVRMEVPVTFDVQYTQKVAVARQRIDRGQSFTPDNIIFDRRVIQGAGEVVPESTNLADYRAKRTILPTQLIATADLESVRENNTVLLKPKDVVKMVVSVNGLRVATFGEVLQEGRAGQTIRLRNITSDKIVCGRVVDRTLVEVGP